MNEEIVSASYDKPRFGMTKYVRNSVGNWLNDASKTQPGFVEALCKRWGKESDVSETKYIIKKAAHDSYFHRKMMTLCRYIVYNDYS